MSRWFRHYAGMMRDDKLVRAAVHSKQPVERVVWVWGAILESAAEVNDGGRYEIDAGEVAYFLRCDVADISCILDGLESLGRVAGQVVVRWRDRQFESDTSRERQRRYRARKRVQGAASGQDSDVTLGESDVTLTSPDGEVTPQETETETESNLPSGERARATPVRLPDGWTASDDDRAYASAKGVPGNVIDREESKFRNHYHGNGVERVDWSAMWRKWIDGTCEKAGYKPALVAVTGTVPSVLIGRGDARWPTCAKRWEAEHGEPPKAIPMNRYPEGAKSFPADWPETKPKSAEVAA